jgi:pyruvate/2-oxoglutarate/acetoin dehydrogenase E1 component
MEVLCDLSVCSAGGRRKPMRRLKVLEALREALQQEMEQDPSIFIIGEDVRIGGGFAVCKGLAERFGEERVLDTPISEIGFTGLAIGSAMSGMRPVVEYQFGDFVFCAMDQIVNEAAKLRYMSAGQVKVPITFRLPVGANRRGAQHAQCSESIFMNVPGLHIVTPSNPYDAKGLLIGAIRSDNPVLFYEHKLLYGYSGEESSGALWTEVPEDTYELPFGKAALRREGNHVTLVSNLLMLHRSLIAAQQLEKEEEISVEVIDPRTLVPLDVTTIAKSAGKTGCLVVVEECQPTGSWGSEVIASVCEHLKGTIRVKRIGTPPTPIPYTTCLENYVIPDVERIKRGIREITRE